MTPAVRENYIAIIDSILANSDLTKISEKKIRVGIQEKVEYDITPQKVLFFFSRAFALLATSLTASTGFDQGANLGEVRYLQC